MILREYLEQKRPGAFSTPPGFKRQYNSFPHYILDITEQIWEKRAIWLLFDTYAEDIIIHSGATTVHGLNTVIHGTLKTLYSFPDRSMLGEDVIWAHYEDTSTQKKTSLACSTEKRFFSSHRILSHATNTGTSPYGIATGKRIHFRTIADCLTKDNIIYEEWLLRDNLHILQQLDFDPIEHAKKDTRYDGIDVLEYTDNCKDILYHTVDDSTIDFIFTLYDTLWTKKKYASMALFYHADAVSHGICDVTYTENSIRENLYDTLLVPFENADATYDTIAPRIQQITATYDTTRTNLAVRWRLKGRYSKESSLFGKVNFATTNIVGINHYTIIDGKIAEEWMLFDAYDTLCQLHRKN